MILVTGAGGKTGRAVIHALAVKRESVRALVRHPDQARAIVPLGAEQAVVGDMLEQEAVRRAMEGVRAVYHICPNVSPDEVTIGRLAIMAARTAGVEQFVYHSVLHPQAEAMPHHWNKLRVEELLFESGLPFTILQPAAYMQNILAGWQRIVEQGVYAVPYPPETRLSLVDLEDVAEAASNVLTELGHTRAIYELVGTRGLSQSEVAEALALGLNTPVKAEAIHLTDWREQARKTGLEEYQVEALAKMFRYYELHGMYGNPNILGWLLRRAPVALSAFLEKAIRDQGIAARTGLRGGW